MCQLSEKGWNKLSNQEEVKEVEVRALFNLIDKDNSGELSLEVGHCSLSTKVCHFIIFMF